MNYNIRISSNTVTIAVPIFGPTAMPMFQIRDCEPDYMRWAIAMPDKHPHTHLKPSLDKRLDPF